MISIDEQVKYWTDGAERDYDTMQALLQSKRYPESLFFGHIVLEKTLKAFVVLETKEQVRDYLTVANTFNIRARYDDYKKAFYKTCTKEYAEENSQKITKLYKDLCQQMKQRKS